MNMSEQVVLVLGYGGRVGADVAKDFASTGYKVAVVSRSKKLYDPTLGYLWIQADLTDPSTVENIFSQVVNELGHPSVVVYNGMSKAFPSRCKRSLTPAISYRAYNDGIQHFAGAVQCLPS